MNASTPEPTATRDDRWILWTLGLLVLALVIVGLITWDNGKDDQEAVQKAQQLTQAYEQAGLRTQVNQKMVVRWLGNDGGAVCDNPVSALGKATLNDLLYNGADFVGRRPVIVDRRILLGEALILKIYCPEKLQKYQDKIDELKTDDTIKD